MPVAGVESPPCGTNHQKLYGTLSRKTDGFAFSRDSSHWELSGVGDKRWHCRGDLERNGRRDPFANVRDRGRPEASHTAAVRFFSHTRDTRCPPSLTPAGLELVASWYRFPATECGPIANVARVGPKVGQILNILEDLWTRPGISCGSLRR